MDIGVIREGLAEMLKAVQDGLGKPQIFPYAMDGPIVPCIRVLRPDLIGYDVAMQGGGDTIDMIVQVLVGNLSEIDSQQLLDSYLGRGAGSVKTAIEQQDPASGARSLGGRVDDVWVRESTGYRVYTVGGAEVLGAEWTVQVETTD